MRLITLVLNYNYSALLLVLNKCYTNSPLNNLQELPKWAIIRQYFKCPQEFSTSPTFLYEWLGGSGFITLAITYTHNIPLHYKLCICLLLGHTRSWGVAYPGILTECYKSGKVVGLGPMDPTKNITYKLIGELFHEVQELFPDKYFHLGGDEVALNCWWDFINC